MDDLISRQAAINEIERAKVRVYHSIERAIGRSITEILDEVEKDVRGLPPSEPKRMTGHWRHYEGELECSVCGARFYDEIMGFCGDGIPHFCLDCGADMRGEQDG